MIEVLHLGKSYRKVEAVSDLCFQVAPGQSYGLLGPNGAGKTSTLRMLSTLVRPSSGTAKVAGADLLLEPLQVRANIGIVSSGMRVADRLSVRETLEFFAALYRLGPRTKPRLDWAASWLGLGEVMDRPVRELSTGMRQKVVIARAILHEPAALLLDEASSGLDVLARRALLDFVTAYREAGHTVLYSTHAMEEAQEVCTAAGFLHQGRLIWQGPVQEAVAAFGSLERAFLERVR